MNLKLIHLWLDVWMLSLSLTVWMESVLIGNLLGFDEKDLQVWACLSMWESVSVITMYWQCFILSHLIQTKNLIPVVRCWCPLFPIRVTSLVMTHDDVMCVSVCHMSKFYYDVMTLISRYHYVNMTKSPNRYVEGLLKIGDSSGAGETVKTEEFETWQYPHPYTG